MMTPVLSLVTSRSLRVALGLTFGLSTLVGCGSDEPGDQPGNDAGSGAGIADVGMDADVHGDDTGVADVTDSDASEADTSDTTGADAGADDAVGGDAGEGDAGEGDTGEGDTGEGDTGEGDVALRITEAGGFGEDEIRVRAGDLSADGTEILFTPAGRIVIVSTGDWSLSAEIPLPEGLDNQSIFYAYFTPDAGSVVLQADTIRLWDRADSTWTDLAPDCETVSGAWLTADGSAAVWSCREGLDWIMHRTVLDGGAVELLFTVTGGAMPIGLSPDDELIVQRDDVEFDLHDLETGEVTQTWAGTAHDFGSAIGFSADGELIGLAGEPEEYRCGAWIHSADEPEIGDPLPTDSAARCTRADGVAFSPDGTFIAAVYEGRSNDALVEFYDTETRELLATLGPIEGSLTHASTFHFSPDGSTFYIVQFNGGVSAWTLERGE